MARPIPHLGVLALDATALAKPGAPAAVMATNSAEQSRRCETTCVPCRQSREQL